MTAILLVIAMPLAAIGLATVSVAWAKDVITRSRPQGLLGVFFTLVAAGNLFVERTCEGTVNRPIISIALGHGDCFKSGLGGVEIVLLVAVATSAVVRFGDVRR